jgi:hypothetical protein
MHAARLVDKLTPDHLIPADADIGSESGFGPGHREGFVRAECAVMRVAYLTEAATELEPVRDEIEILIPSEDAVFEATYPSSRVGNRTRTSLRSGPQISIIPANRPHPTYRPRASDMLVIALNPVFYDAKVRAALGFETPNFIEHWGIVDPFVREIGNALRAEFRMLRIPSTVYLECWAGVIAIHIATTYGRRYDVNSGLRDRFTEVSHGSGEAREEAVARVF